MSILTGIGLIVYIVVFFTSIIFLIEDDESNTLKLKPWARATLWVIAFPIGLIVVFAKCVEYVIYRFVLFARYVKTTLSPYVYEERNAELEEE